jgi:hypothetical protein
MLRGLRSRFLVDVGLAVAVICGVLLVGGPARAAATAPGTCKVPTGARRAASVAGVRVWQQAVPTPASVRRQYGAAATYPRYSGCVSGHRPQVLFRDYLGDDVVVRVAGDYVGLLDRGGMESLYLSDLLTGRTTSTTSFTPSVQDNGGSEANEPGPLITWTVTPNGWLVYLDTLSDFEGFGTALDAVAESGATTLDLAAPGPSSGAAIGGLVVKGKTVSWRSSFSGSHRVTLGPALLPRSLPKRLPSACHLVPPSLARELLGPLAATSPPPPHVPPAGFQPPARTGTDRSGCAYAAAADPTQTLDIAEQRVTPAIVSQQLRAINRTPRADNALVLPGTAAVLDSRIEFLPSGPEDLRLFVHDVEVDLTTNSDRAAHEIEAAGLAIERALHDVPPAGAHT